MKSLPTILFFASLSVLVSGCSQPKDETATSKLPVSEEPAETSIERAARLELDTDYVPPPGDPMAHHTMGFARTLCSGVFVTGLDPDFAAENIGYFTGPYEHRHVVVKREVDYDERLADGPWQARIVKLADVYDNGLDLPRPGMRRKCTQRCERAWALTEKDDHPAFVQARAAVKALLESLRADDRD